MGDMNAKVGVDTNGRQKLIVRHGLRAEMNGNGGRWADFFQVDELVRGGTQCRKGIIGHGFHQLVVLNIS